MNFTNLCLLDISFIELFSHITRSTCVISSSLGLERKRFLMLFRTPALFRTYVEAATLVQQVQGNEALAYSLKAGRLNGAHGVIPPNEFEKHAVPPKEAAPAASISTPTKAGDTAEAKSPASSGYPQGEVPVDAAVAADEADELLSEPNSPKSPRSDKGRQGEQLEADSVAADSTLRGTILDSIYSFRLDPQILLQDTVEGTLEHAADVMAQRQRSMVDMISVLENYYALLGIPHRKARAAALYATLGFTPEGYAEMGAGVEEDDMSIESAHSLGSADSKDMLRNVLKAVRVASYPALMEGLMCLQQEVAVHFRRQFSKYIKVVDIPKCESLAVVAKPKVDAAAQAKAKLKRLKASQGKTVDIVAGLVSAMSRDNVDPMKSGDGELRDDGANDDDEQEKIHALQHGVPIHNDKIIKKIFAYDMKLTGRAAIVAEGLEAWSMADDEDDDMSIATQQSHNVSSVKTAGSLLLGRATADAPVAEGAADSKLSAEDFPAVPLGQLRMMANPVASAQAENDAEMKLLQFLEQEAARKEARSSVKGN